MTLIYMDDMETHEDIIIVNSEIARGLETGELVMPTYGNIQNSKVEEQNNG